MEDDSFPDWALDHELAAHAALATLW